MKHLRFALSVLLFALASCSPPLEPRLEAGRPNWNPCALLACDDAGEAGSNEQPDADDAGDEQDAATID